MTRHEVREQAFILIFESLFRDDTPDEIIEVAKENEEAYEEKDLQQFLNSYPVFYKYFSY